MRVLTPFTAPRALLAVIAVGLAGFVAFHTLLLFSVDQPVHVLFRRVWLAGLGLVVVLGVYLSVTERRPAER